MINGVGGAREGGEEGFGGCEGGVEDDAVDVLQDVCQPSLQMVEVKYGRRG